MNYLINALKNLGVKTLCNDSRLVKAEDCFVAYQGALADGREYIEQAIARGATVVIQDVSEDALDESGAVPIYSVKDLKSKLGILAREFYGQPDQDLKLIGVTGTNGKTSVTQLLAQMMGNSCAVIGSLGNGFWGELESTKNTTPDVLEVYRLLAEFRDCGAEYVAMEVSSHALAQGRVEGLTFEVAVFTNLTQDHLDYHHTMDNYFAAKTQLFDVCKSTVICLNDEWGRKLYQMVHNRYPCLSYGVGGDVLLECSGNPLQLELSYQNEFIKAPTQLVGQFNGENLAAVVAVALVLNLPFQESCLKIPKLSPIPGRMECFGGGDQPLVVVDYAHTPDALVKALSALKQEAVGRLFCVFGCGGDRDKTKRPLMAAAAESLADVVMVTDDNPRFEGADTIMQDVKSGFENLDKVLSEHDRKKAIATVLAMADCGDVILVAGKGREEYQDVAGVKSDYSDIQSVKENLSSRATQGGVERS